MDDTRWIPELYDAYAVVHGDGMVRRIIIIPSPRKLYEDEGKRKIPGDWIKLFSCQLDEIPDLFAALVEAGVLKDGVLGMVLDKERL